MTLHSGGFEDDWKGAGGLFRLDLVLTMQCRLWCPFSRYMPLERSQGKRCATGSPWLAAYSAGMATIPASMLIWSQSSFARVSFSSVYGVCASKAIGTLRARLAAKLN